MKKLFITFVTILMLIPSLYLFSYAENSGDWQYYYDDKLGGYILQNYCGTGGEIAVPTVFEGGRVVGVGYIGGRTDITKVTIPEGVVSMNGTFYNMTNISQVVLPDTLEEVWAQSFTNCGLKELYLPKNTKVLALDAVYKTNLEILSIPAECTIASGSVSENPHLKKIIISGSGSRNKVYNDTIVVENERNCVIAYATGSNNKIEVIPDGVGHIHSLAMYGCQNLETLVIPSSFEWVGFDEIAYSPKLKNVYIKSNCEVSSDAFRNCSDELTVYCNGPIETSGGEPKFAVKSYTPGMEDAIIASYSSNNKSLNNSSPIKDNSVNTGNKNTSIPETTITQETTITEETTIFDETTIPAEDMQSVITDTQFSETENSKSKVFFIVVCSIIGLIIVAAIVLFVLDKKKIISIKELLNVTKKQNKDKQ